MYRHPHSLLGAAACIVGRCCLRPPPPPPKYTHNTCTTRSPLTPAHPALPAAQCGHPQDVARHKAPFDTPEATNPSLSSISTPAALILLLAVETSRITPDLKAGICFQWLAAAAAQTPGSQMETPAASMPASQRRHFPDFLYSNPLHHTNTQYPLLYLGTLLLLMCNAYRRHFQNISRPECRYLLPVG